MRFISSIKTRIFRLLSIFLLAGIVPGFAGAQEKIIRNLNTNQGLSNNYVTAITQDKRGFIYIGTQSGLNRFDGHSFKHYNVENTGMDGDNITTLFYDKTNDRIWVGTKSGLYVFSLPDMRLVNIKFPSSAQLYNINDIQPASDGGIWITNHYQNVVYYDPQRKVCRIYKTKDYSGMPTDMLTAVDDGDGKLLVGHYNDGVSEIDIATGKRTQLQHDPADPTSLPGNRVKVIYSDSFNNLWFGTSQGLGILDPQTHKFKVFHHKASEPGSIAGNSIYSIMETQGGEIWIATDLGGVSIANVRDIVESGDKEFNRFINITDTNDSKGLSSKSIRSLFTDSYGNIWIGNFSSGVDVMPHMQPLFRQVPWFSVIGNGVRNKPIWSIVTDKNGDLWAGSENEIALFRDNKHIRTIDLTPYLTRPFDRVENLAVMGDRILIGLDNNGVLELSADRNTIKRIPFPGVADHAMNSFNVVNDTLAYISTEKGLYIYSGNKIRSAEEINNKIRWLCVNTTAVDRAGNLWVGTYGAGIFIFDKENNLLATLDRNNIMQSTVINQLNLDSRGNMWVATGNGVSLFERADFSTKPKVIDSSMGLDERNCRSVAEGRNGDIWIITDNSIACWDTELEKMIHFDSRNGLPSSSFMSRAVTIAPDSTIYAGALNGIWRVNPIDKNNLPKIAPIVISGCFFLSDSKENFTEERFKISAEGKVKIPHDRNSIRIVFSVPDYSESNSVEYSYMMQGIDNEWHALQNNNFVIFRNLAVGNYIFRVRGKLMNGEEISETSLKLKVYPPLLLSWYFLLLYAAIIIGIIWYIIIRRDRHVKKHAAMKSQLEITENQQKLNNERLRFYTDISHELRTPLTLILGPVEDLKHAGDIPEKYHEKIDMINYNAQNLLMLISQLLEFHKTENSNRQLSVRKDDLSSLVTEIALRFKEYNRNENLKITLDIDRSLPPIYFDRKIISTILNNLVSNALKYTKLGGVIVGMRRTSDGKAEIYVSDTGIGISAEDLPHLFERFYRVDENSSVVGTGIGLSLSKTLADLHHASLTVESELGKGSTFRLSLSIDETYPEALHKGEKSDENQEQAAVKSKKPILLIVEDNADIRDYVKASFKETFRVETAADGEEGLIKARSTMPNIIISDIMMPKMDGIEMCRRLKEDFATSHIPVVLLTAKDSMEDKEEGYAAGAVSYITKPFSARLLKTRIDNIIEANRKLVLKFSRGEISSEDFDLAGKDGAAISRTISEDNENQEIRSNLSKLDQEFLNKLRSIVLDNLTNPKFGMLLIAEQMNMSSSTLYRKISVLTGTTAVKHVRNIRLMRSCELIDEGHTVSEAAFACGFNDLTYYRACFKEVFGMPPSMYKKKGNK